MWAIQDCVGLWVALACFVGGKNVVVVLEECTDCDRNLALSTHLEQVKAHLVHHGVVYIR